MRRISREWLELAEQLFMAGDGISGEPGWPGSAPTQAQVVAAGNSIQDLRSQIVELESQLRGVRAEFLQAMGQGTELMRRVDDTTSGLYGKDSPRKLEFGLPKWNGSRRSPGPTPQVTGLELSDGGTGAIQAQWKVVPRATFEVQWFADGSLTDLMGALVATRATALIPALQPGTQIWVRVRALRGGKYGDWSETATRIANI